MTSPENPQDAAPPEPGSPCVLLVEDHPTSAKIAELVLEALGLASHWVQNGAEALLALEQRRYALVLMDVVMPVMDGLEAAREIRRRWPGPERQLIIAMTSLIDPSGRDACLAAGMDDFMAKPLSKSGLAAKLAHFGIAAPGAGVPRVRPLR